MKFPILLVAIVLTSSITIGGVTCMRELERMREIARICMEENGSHFDVLRGFRLKHLNPEDINDNDKCGMECFMMRSGIIGFDTSMSKNSINHTRVDYLFGELERKDEMIEALKQCEEDIAVLAHCEHAFEAILCVRDYLEWEDE